VKHLHYATDGYHTRSPDEVKQFEAHHKVGTKAHLALALMLYLGVRRGDAVRLGKQHVRNGACISCRIRRRLAFGSAPAVMRLGYLNVAPMACARPAHPILAERRATDRQLMAIPEDQNENSDCPTELSRPGKKLDLTIFCKGSGSTTRTAILRPRGLFGGGSRQDSGARPAFRPIMRS
jgi:hypothetical protein